MADSSNGRVRGEARLGASKPPLVWCLRAREPTLDTYAQTAPRGAAAVWGCAWVWAPAVNVDKKKQKINEVPWKV